jgi:hypothetical protein
MVLLIAGCAPHAALPAQGPAPSAGPVTASHSEVPQGDQPPNAAVNNGWKQRHELSAADRRRAERDAERIRPALQRVHDGGDMGSGPTRQALLGLGYPGGDVTVAAMRVGEGAAFGVRVGPLACVIGSVTPAGVRMEVAGSAAEYGCLEPFSH